MDFGIRRDPPCSDCDRDGHCTMNCGPVVAPDKPAADPLTEAVLAYISECDNPVPDYSHRRTLRNHMRTLVGAPAEPPPRERR